MTFQIFLSVFATFWAVTSNERERETSYIGSQHEGWSGEQKFNGRSRKEQFSLQPHSEWLQFVDSLPAKVQANQQQSLLGLSSHQSFIYGKRTMQTALVEFYIFWTNSIPFATRPFGPFTKTKPKKCALMDCTSTRRGIGRRVGGLIWIYACVIPFGIVFLIAAATSMKPRSHGKLGMQTGKAVAAMLFAIVFAFIYGCSVRDISSLTLSKLCLLSIGSLGLMLSVIATFWFIDIEVARPHMTSTLFLSCMSVFIFLIALSFDTIGSIGLVAFQLPNIPIILQVLVSDASNGVSSCIAAILPRNIALLVWVCYLWKFYVVYFYFWDDTTGDSLALISPVRFPSFLLTITSAMLQFAVPYSRDRYFVTAFGLVLATMEKLGHQKHAASITEVIRAPEVVIRVVEVFVFTFACSIVMRYQIVLPSQLQKVKYVRLGYLYEMRRNAQKITRCQEVPETAFGNPAKVVHLIIISHHWLDGHTCDVATSDCPHGFRLATICQRLERFFPWSWPGFSEFCKQPMTFFSRLIFSIIFFDDDVLIFFDFMSLPQIGITSDGKLIQRTTEETALFKEILPACGLLYTMFPVLVCPEVSDGVTSYMSSGWCFCEWEQAQLCGTLRPYSEDLENGILKGQDTGSGFDFIESELKGKGFRCEPDRDVVRDIVKGTWIRRELHTAVVAQNAEQFRALLNQLTDHDLQVTIDFPVDSSTLDTLLHITKRNGVSTEIETLLINYGADPDRCNHRGEKPGQFLFFPRSWCPCLWQ